MLKDLKKVTLYSHIMMMLTSIHHVYGAVIYNTPWRLHVLFLSIPVISVTALLTYFIKRKDNLKTSLLFWLHWSIILIGSIALIGVFEGVYNHFFKDLLFYAGVNRFTLLKLFPPPTYEMPNDLFFELTGVLQAVVVVILINWFIRLTFLVFKPGT